MAAFSQVSQNKRGRDEYLNGGLPLPDAKRKNSAFVLADDSDLMAFLDKIDNMDNNHCNVEDTHSGTNEIKGDENGLKVQTDDDFESTDEKGRTIEMGSNKEGQLTADSYCEATWVVSDIGNVFTNYDAVRADHDFFLDSITLDDLQIIKNLIHRDSLPDVMYSDAVETTEAFYWSLWEDDISHMNGHPVIQNDFEAHRQHPVIQNDFEAPRQEESEINRPEIHEVWK